MPIPSRSASRSTLRNLGSERDDNTIEKVRNYDGTYNTREPLKNRPNEDFQNKKLDLDEEDVTSSEGGSMYRDKVAKDFEYRSQDGAGSTTPRQMGRRAQRQSAIQEEDDNPQNNTYLAASPVDSPPPPQPNFTTYPSASYDNEVISPEQSPPQIRNLVITNPSGSYYRGAPTSPPLSQSVGLPSPTGDGRSTQV